MTDYMNPEKEKIAAGYDAIIEQIGLDESFYERCLAMHRHYSGSILDIGCGRGLLLKKLHERAPDLALTGIDISEKLCEISKKNVPTATIIRGDAEALPFPDESFDFIFMTEVLEHMLDYDKAVSELCRVLKLGGSCVITVPNRDWASYDFYDKIRNKQLQPVDDHYFRFEEMRSLLEQHGLHLIAVKGSDNLYYYGWKHRLEQVAAFFLPFLHKKMKRLICKCTKLA